NRAAIGEVEFDEYRATLVLQKLRCDAVDRPDRVQPPSLPLGIGKGVVVEHQRGHKLVQEVIGAHIRVRPELQQAFDMTTDGNNLLALPADMPGSELCRITGDRVDSRAYRVRLIG